MGFEKVPTSARKDSNQRKAKDPPYGEPLALAGRKNLFQTFNELDEVEFPYASLFKTST